jgi:hypothetical protein
MRRQHLEHILRAAAAITGTDQFLVIGSQSILGSHPDPPDELLASMEADIVSLRSDHDNDLIDGSIGEMSPFHQTFGYYAHGVSAAVATLPDGWRDRLVPFRSEHTGGATGLCLEAHDLAVSKIVAGREKDLNYVRVLARRGLIDGDTLAARLAATRLTPEVREICLARVKRITG